MSNAECVVAALGIIAATFVALRSMEYRHRLAQEKLNHETLNSAELVQIETARAQATRSQLELEKQRAAARGGWTSWIWR